MKLYTLESKLLNIEEEACLFMKTIGAFTITRDTITKYYSIKRERLNKRYGLK